MTQYILHESTEAIEFYPPVELGVPSTVTVRVQTPAQSMQDSPGDSVTPDAVSASTNAAAAQGATSLAFASDPTCTAGRFYIASDGEGRTFAVKVVKTGSTVYLAQGLPYPLPSGATLSGYHCSHALTAAETGTAGEGVAIWIVDGVEYRRNFWIVQAKLAHTLNSSELVKLYPVVAELRDNSDEDYTETLDAGFEKLEFELMAAGIRPERIISPGPLKQAYAAACVMHLVENDQRIDQTERGDWRERFTSIIGKALKSRAMWYDESEDLGGRPDETTIPITGITGVR